MPSKATNGRANTTTFGICTTNIIVSTNQDVFGNYHSCDNIWGHNALSDGNIVGQPIHLLLCILSFMPMPKFVEIVHQQPFQMLKEPPPCHERCETTMDYILVTYRISYQFPK